MSRGDLRTGFHSYRTTAAVAGNAAELTKNVPKELLIDGNFVPAQSGKTFAIIDPRNEEVGRPE